MLKLQSSLRAACMAVAALTALSCSQDDLTDQSALKGNTTIVASFEEADTRTSVNDKNKVVWEKDDAFGLFYTTDSKDTPKVAQFSCSTANGTSTSASFSGTLDDNATTSYAVYPYDKSMSLSGSTVTMELPAEFKYTKASNGPMYVSASDISNKLNFKHLAGLLKLTVSKGIDAKAKKFVITADKKIAGTCTADLSTTDPTLTVSSTGKNTIIVNLEIETAGSMTFYIPIPTGTYATLSAQLLDSDDKALYTPKEWTDITVARAGMLTASFGYITIDAGTPADINKAVADALPKEAPETPTTTNFELSGAIDATKENTPIIIPAMKNSNVELSLANIPTTTADKPLELTAENNTETPAAAVNTLTVAIPSVEDNQTGPSFTITMPKTTVTLAPTGATTTYNKVIAKTATNTIVVAAGVTVKELVIAGGNVEIYGTVDKLVRDNTNSTTVEVSSFDAANIKEVTSPDYFTFKSTWDGTSKVEPTANKIYTAAQLAYYQSKTAPNTTNCSSLPVTINSDIELYADIDLANKPWLGMIISGKAFDGKSHTIKNLNMSEYILNQQETSFTPEACIGLFAAVYGASTVKEITLNHVTIKPDASKSPKWVGSLVGFSKGNGTIYTNCVAKNVEILTKGKNSYRVGGLIGYIEKSTGTTAATATLTGCKVETASIAASFSYGGLVGSLFDSVEFTNCSTSNITLSLNGDCTDALGYVSKFIGDVTNNSAHNRVIQFTNCSADLLTKEEQTALNFSGISSQQNKAGEYTPVSPFVGIVDYPAQMTINVGNKTLVNGTDYNHFILTETGSNSAEGYDKTKGSWAD